MITSANSVQPRVVILCATDSTAASKDAIAAAARFAELPGSELHLVHVTSSDLGNRAAVEAEGAKLTEELKATGTACSASIHLSSGTPWKAIVQVATNLHADLIVVGSHGRTGMKHALLGSVAEAVVKKAPCPVYVARPTDYSKATPEVEPACADCVSLQFESRGAKLWCARHSERHAHGRLHYEISEGFGQGSQLLHV